MLGEKHESPSDNFSMKVGDKPDIRPNKMAGIELHLASLYSFYFLAFTSLNFFFFFFSLINFLKVHSIIYNEDLSWFCI